MSIFSQNIESAIQITRTIRGSEFWEQIVERCVQHSASIQDGEFYIKDSCLYCKHYGGMLCIHLDMKGLTDIRRILPEVTKLNFGDAQIHLGLTTDIYGKQIGITHITANLIHSDARLIDSMEFGGLQLNLVNNPYMIRNSVFKSKIVLLGSLFSWPNFVNVSWDGVEEIKIRPINPLENYEPFQCEADFWHKIVGLEAAGSRCFRITVPSGFSVSKMFQNFSRSIKTIRIENMRCAIIFEHKPAYKDITFHPNTPGGLVQSVDGWNAYICL